MRSVNMGIRSASASSIWDGIVGDTVVIPYQLLERLTAQRYYDFPETVSPGLLEDVSL
jgi:hypothetical protein